MSTNLLISFEGGEGCGKTTQIKRLASRLTEAGKNLLLTREPGGGWIDRLDKDGDPATDFMPASTLYHILCALDELDRFAPVTQQ